MADSADAATADARKTLLALACLLSAFFLIRRLLHIENISLREQLSHLQIETLMHPHR
jgi:hypothetical protein|nr:MAG TPA: hypothetical protein [Caudoviricetes sp.]